MAAGPTVTGLTGAQARQVIETGTLADYTQRLLDARQLPANVVALPTAARTVTAVRHTQLDPGQVEVWIDLIDGSGLVDWLETHRANEKLKPGRPATVSVRAILVGFALAYADGVGGNLKALRDVLYYRIDPVNQARLGLAPLPQSAIRKVQDKIDAAAYQNVRRAFHRFLNIIDPSIHPKGRKRTWDELFAAAKKLDPEQQLARQARLDTFTVQLLAISIGVMRANGIDTDQPGYCLDGTHIELFARGRGKNDVEASTDPDGGYYTRTDDHAEDTTATKFQAFSLDMHTATLSDISDPDRMRIPTLAVAVAAARPGVDTKGNTHRLLAAMETQGYQPTYLAGDGLYTNHIRRDDLAAIRRNGWLTLFALRDSHHGRTNLHGHIIEVEGELYCPSIPKHLINATKDHEAGRISDETYRKRIDARQPYAMRVHDSNKARNQVRLDCPAAGTCPQAQCPLKQLSMQPRLTTLTDAGEYIDARPVVPLAKSIDTANLPSICSKAHTTMDSDEYLAAHQPVRYGTPEWNRIHQTLRSAQEGYHGFVKDPNRENLGDPGKRRTGGIAAQTVFTAFAYLAANMRKIRTFLANAEPDKNGVLWVQRPKAKEEAAKKRRAAKQAA